jgi:anti-sigma regulatory factor (Ser/Thr protein kinase)
MMIMKLNPVLLLCCCLFSGGILHGQADLPFAFEWKVGKTYWLDVRQEERKHYDRPYHTDFILLERVTWSFQVLQKKGDSIFLKAVPLRYRSQRGSLNDGNYFDSQYHQEPETYDSWNLCDKEFSIIINPQGRVLRHQIMIKGKPVETKSKLKTQPFLWEIKPPVLEEQFQWSLAHEKDQYEVEPFIRIFDYTHLEKEAYLTHYHFGKNQQLSIDNASQWIKYGTFTETKADGTQKSIWIRGWSDPVATVTGKFTHFKTEGGIREKDELLSYLRFRCGVKAQFDLYTDGSFSLKMRLARNIVFELFDVPIFLSPGDHLEVHADFRDQDQATYQGNSAKENELSRLMWKRDTLENKDALKTITITNTRKGSEPFYKEVKQDFIIDSMLLLNWKKQVNPFCFWDIFWVHRYKEGWRLLEFNSLSRFPGFEQLSPKKHLARLESLPVLNDWCEYSYDYPNFLGYRYPGYKANKLRVFDIYSSNMHKSGINKLMKFILTGDPLYQVLYNNISVGYVFFDKDYPELELDAEDFMRTCPDTVLSDNVKKFFKTEQNLSQGKALPNFEVYNLKGKKLNAKKLRGKKTILHLELDSHSFGHIEYAKLTKRHPSLNIVHIYPLPYREFKQKFSGKNLPPPYTEDNLFFPKDLEAAQLIHDRFCFNEGTKWDESAYNRLYFVNEASVISDFMDNSEGPRQISADFAYRLLPFLAQKTALKPQFTWLYIILANLLLLGSFLALRTRYIRRREARKRRLTEMELKSLRAQLNPHFIFNTMGSIQHLIASQQSEKANDYLADLAALMRLVLRATQKGIISLREELDLVEQYCALENLRKPFTLHLDIAPELDVNACEVPALLLQPYVENAILHGLAAVNEGGKIELQLRRDGPFVLISIHDNGVGIHQARQKNSNGTQSGLKMNQERLQLMYGTEASVHIIDLAEKDPTESGTTVTLKLPCC